MDKLKEKLSRLMYGRYGERRNIMKSSAIVKKALHKADGVLYPVAGRKDKVVITISSCNVMQ